MTLRWLSHSRRRSPRARLWPTRNARRSTSALAIARDVDECLPILPDGRLTRVGLIAKNREPAETLYGAPQAGLAVEEPVEVRFVFAYVGDAA